MSTGLVVIMMVMIALLTAAVCAVHWRKPAGSAPEAPPEQPSEALPPPYAPPAGSLWTAQLEIGQTFYVQTISETYALTLLDPVTGRYETVRTVVKDGKPLKERFQALVIGTFVPYRGMVFREFVLGGNLSYQKIADGSVIAMQPSSRIERILFDFSAAHEPLQQAS